MADEHTKQINDMGKQQCHMPESDAKVFEFLRLPAEIRNKIYWNVLVKRHMVYRFRQPALTLVNKQIRSECLPVLYGNGLFSVFLGRRYRDFFRFQGLWEAPPSPPNLMHITKLDIRLNVDPRKGGFDVEIRMRKNEWECGRLLNKKLVGKPGVEWKNKATIQAVYDRISSSLLRGDPSLEILKVETAILEGNNLVVRGLLYFSEKCPAAAEWVWMAPKRHRHSNRRIII